MLLGPGIVNLESTQYVAKSLGPHFCSHSPKQKLKNALKNSLGHDFINLVTYIHV